MSIKSKHDHGLTIFDEIAKRAVAFVIYDPDRPEKSLMVQIGSTVVQVTGEDLDMLLEYMEKLR